MTTKTDLVSPAYNSSNWNTSLNSNFGVLNNALGNTESVSVASADVTLTATQAQNMRVAVSGTMTANRTLFFPAGCTGFWIVTNATSGAYTLTVQNTSGTNTVIVSQGTSAIVYSDGTNVGFADDGSGVPVGSIIQSAGTAAPNGYLLCDGTEYSTTGYARLFSAIGTTWGSGTGTFKVPDLRGAFLRGSGAGLNPASRSVGSYQADDVKPHNHGVTDPGHTHTGKITSAVIDGNSFENTYVFNTSASQSSGWIASTTTGISINNSTGTETVPKNYAVLYCIKY